MKVLQKVKTELPNGPAIPPLGISPMKMKTLTQKDICTPTFIAPLFTTVKTRKQPQCLSAGKWMKAARSAYTTRKDEILPSAMTRMDLEGTMLSHTEKGKGHIISLYVENKREKNKRNLTDAENRLAVTNGEGDEERLEG